MSPDPGTRSPSQVRKDTISDDLAQLRQGISVLENQLREQVVSHHGRLIEQVAQAKDLEALTDTVTDGVARLQVHAKSHTPQRPCCSSSLPALDPVVAN